MPKYTLITRYSNLTPPDRDKTQLKVLRIKETTAIWEEVTVETSITKRIYDSYFEGKGEAVEGIGCVAAKDVPRSGLVAEYLFFEGSGADIHDTSENANHGLSADGYGLKAGYTWKQLANGKWAVEFDGSTGYGEIPHSTSLIIDKEITIIAWGFIKSLDTHFELVNKYAWNVWRFLVNKGYQKLQFVQDTDTELLTCVGETNVVDENLLNRWNQFAVSCKSGNIIFCINGEVDKTFVDTYNTLVTNISSVYIGRYIDSYATGQFGLVRIYNKALTQSELKAIYNAEKPIFLE